MSKGRKIAAELHRQAVNRAYAKRMEAARSEPEASAAPPSVNYVQEVRPHDPPPSCHVCGALMVPTRFNCRSCGATTEPTEAAPPEREAEPQVICPLCHASDESRPWISEKGIAMRSCLRCSMNWREFPARAAVPQDRASIEQQAAYYFSEIRKFSPLNLDRYSLENWKDFIVWREARAAVPQAAADRKLLTVLEQSHLYFLQSNDLTPDDREVLDEMYYAIRKARAAAVPAPGRVHKADCYFDLNHKGECGGTKPIGGATAPPKEG